MGCCIKVVILSGANRTVPYLFNHTPYLRKDWQVGHSTVRHLQEPLRLQAKIALSYCSTVRSKRTIRGWISSNLTTGVNLDAIFWGVMAPDVVETRRAGLDLGLRSALLHYGDMSVPGIGGAYFVRQLVWPCLAIAIKEGHGGRSLKVSKARLATAIEALACKLWLSVHPNSTPDQRQGRVPGIRSLPAKDWTFRDLGPAHGYVSNPRRRAATRALPEKSGLGFTSGGMQLEGMSLTPRGWDLVEPILKKVA